MNVLAKALCFAAFLASACGRSASVETHFSSQQADTLLVNIMTYLFVPEGVHPESRFEPRFRSTYYLDKEKFSLMKLLRISDGYYYYLILRRESDGHRRALGGRFRAEGTHVSNLEELFVGPVLSQAEALRNGEYVFREMVKSRGLPPHMAGLKHFVEWPNKLRRYDTLSHSWILIDSTAVQ
jgi:hypothetical protein